MIRRGVFRRKSLCLSGKRNAKHAKLRQKRRGTAFRRSVEFASDSRQAYIGMAWVLYMQKKFGEDVEMLQERVASALMPTQGSAPIRARLLGAVFAKSLK